MSTLGRAKQSRTFFSAQICIVDVVESWGECLKKSLALEGKAEEGKQNRGFILLFRSQLGLALPPTLVVSYYFPFFTLLDIISHFFGLFLYGPKRVSVKKGKFFGSIFVWSFGSAKNQELFWKGQKKKSMVSF